MGKFFRIGCTLNQPSVGRSCAGAGLIPKPKPEDPATDSIRLESLKRGTRAGAEARVWVLCSPLGPMETS